MEIQEGMLYSIVTMPANISIDAVEGIVSEFKDTFLTVNPQAKILLRMKELLQLHKAGLCLIEQMQSAISANGGELVIAEVSDAVENALKHAEIHNKVPIFKTILDFEKDYGLDLSVDLLESGMNPDDTVSEPIAESRPPPHVMIIEPSLTSRCNFRKYFKNLHITKISEAKDCIEANRMLRAGTEKIDIILINIAQASMQGASFIKAVTALPSASGAKCLLFMAEKANQNFVAEAMAAGALGSMKDYGSEKEIQELLLRVW